MCSPRCRPRGRSPRVCSARPARQLGGRRVEALVPEDAELAKPGVDLTQRSGIDGVQPPRPVGTHPGEAVLPQHLQVLRGGRLGDAELPVHDLGQPAGRLLAVGEQLQHSASDRVTEDVERVHGRNLKP